jgi:hypothetical protein
MTRPTGGAWSKTNPISTTDDGWYLDYSGFANLLWYNNGGYQSQSFPLQSNFTYGDIETWYMILKNYLPYAGTFQVMPTINIMSKPTGSGDVATGVYHSIWSLTCDAGQSINYGESIMIYSGLTSSVKTNDPECRRIKYSVTGGAGDRLATEVINHIEFYINYGGAYKILVVEGGIYVKNQGLLNYYFTADKASNADIATIAMNTKISSIGTTTYSTVNFLNTCDVRSLSYNSVYSVISNQTIISGSATGNTGITQSLNFRRDAVLQWYDDGSRYETGGIVVYGDQGATTYIYIGTIYPYWDAVAVRRMGSLKVDGTKYTGYFFQNLGSSTVIATCNLVMS